MREMSGINRHKIYFAVLMYECHMKGSRYNYTSQKKTL